MHPVLHGSITHALVKCICREYQDEVTCTLYTLDKFILKFASFQLLYIYENTKSSDLQMHFQKARECKDIA